MNTPKETALNTRSFIKKHYHHFWQVVAHVLPLIIILNIFTMSMTDYIVTSVFDHSDIEPTSPSFTVLGYSLSLFTVIWALNITHMAMNGYLMAVIAISWHRLVINGSENYRIMSIFIPRWHEIQFITLLAVLYIIVYGSFFAFPILMMSLPFSIAMMDFGYIFPVMMLVLGCFMAFLFFKCSFYFPAKAANRQITIMQSFDLTRGYFGKIILSYIRASWRVGLAATIYSAVLMFLTPYLMQLIYSPANNAFDSAPSTWALHGITLIMGLPFMIFFSPMFLVIGVTIVSNYYLQSISEPEQNDDIYEDML
ncbi:MAG: hypothetical protein ACRBDL_10555 [Alphaproteobacteria bacterium]